MNESSQILNEIVEQVRKVSRIIIESGMEHNPILIMVTPNEIITTDLIFVVA